jgi:hypothetical protein
VTLTATCFRGTFANSGARGNDNKEPIKYYDPWTWPAFYTEADIKNLLKGKLKDPQNPPNYSEIKAALRSTDSGRIHVVLSLMRNVIMPSNLLEDAVIRSLPFVKSGSLFAAHPEDQTQLVDIMRYLEDLERAPTPAALSQILPPACGMMPFLALESVKRDVRRHVWDRQSEGVSNRRTALLCNSGCAGSGKTTQQQHTTAEAVMMLREMVNADTAGSAEKFRWRPLGFYVTFNTQLTDRYLDCTFMGKAVPILTRIALRMAYSVLTWRAAGKTTSRAGQQSDATNRHAFVEQAIHDHLAQLPQYDIFAQDLLNYCNTDDMSNFGNIIGALRKVLKWDGPMFIAIDEFAKAAAESQIGVVGCLTLVCTKLLDDAKTLPISAQHDVYERYICASVYDAVDTVQLATASKRPIISQAMPLLGVRHLAASLTAWVKKHRVGRRRLPREYTNILGSKRAKLGPLSTRQLLFLIHLSLSSGNPRVLDNCLLEHSKDVANTKMCRRKRPFFYHPTVAAVHDTLFWTRAQQLALKDVALSSLGNACLNVTNMIVGASDVDIVARASDTEHRVFALDPKLAEGCTIASSPPTRLLVSPFFLRSVKSYWPARHSSISHHFSAFLATLERCTACTAALVLAGDKLLMDPMPKICEGLLVRWKDSNIVGFEDSTLDAISLHLACVLHTDLKDAPGLAASSVLERICSRVTDAYTLRRVLLSRGPLERIEVRNFPLSFFDAFSVADSQRAHDSAQAVCEHFDTLCLQHAVGSDKYISDAVTKLQPSVPSVRTAVGTTSYELLQDALAAGSHFCFKPSNPNNHGEDGVVFLREEGANNCSWVVLLIQNKYWFHEGCWRSAGQQLKDKKWKSVVDVWRNCLGHLPATVTDKRGAAHTLRYVRILVTANPIRDGTFQRPEPPQDRDRRALLAHANAAFSGLSPEKREEVGDAATKWMTNLDDSKCLRAKDRATWLLEHLGAEYPTLPTDVLQCGPVIAECHMDLDKITEWCPTVGLFAGNIVQIKNLSEREPFVNKPSNTRHTPNVL